jgi:adenylosuccinate synthase
VGYEFDGEELGYPPESTARLARCQPIYENLAGWNDDITGIESYKDLPINAKTYVEKLEDLLGVDITGVSIGPGREQTLFRD